MRTEKTKSTLIKLILGFYPFEKGDLYFDDEKIQDIDLYQLRQHVSLVSQDVYLFHGTIAENIAYGKIDASIEEIQNAAKKAASQVFRRRFRRANRRGAQPTPTMAQLLQGHRASPRVHGINSPTALH